MITKITSKFNMDFGILQESKKRGAECVCLRRDLMSFSFVYDVGTSHQNMGDFLRGSIEEHNFVFRGEFCIGMFTMFFQDSDKVIDTNSNAHGAL